MINFITVRTKIVSLLTFVFPVLKLIASIAWGIAFIQGSTLIISSSASVLILIPCRLKLARVLILSLYVQKYTLMIFAFSFSLLIEQDTIMLRSTNKLFSISLEFSVFYSIVSSLDSGNIKAFLLSLMTLLALALVFCFREESK